MRLLAKKKKGIAEGSRRAGHRALFQKTLSFILSLLIIFSVFPSTVFGATVDSSTLNWELYAPTRYTGKVNTGDTFANMNVKLSSINKIIINSNRTVSISQKEKLNITYTLSSPAISDVGSCFILDTNDYLNYSSGSTVKEKISCSFDKRSNSFECSWVCDKNYGENPQFFLVIENPTFKNPNDYFSICVTSCRYIINNEEQNFFEGVQEWFKSLFELLISKFTQLGESISKFSDNVKSWFSDLGDTLSSFSESVGGWFSNLSQSIKSFFTELKDKLTDLFNDIKKSLSDWFSSVGQWFRDLGDKISGFFENLWQNFSNFFEEIGQKISDWWESVKEFFHNLFVPEDGYFEKYKQDWEDWARAHFALFYDVMDVADDILGLFLTEFGDSDHLVFTIPELSLPILDHNVFMQETSLDMGELVHSHSAFTFIYNTYRVGISGVFYFMLLKYLQRTLSQVIVGEGDVL